MNYDELIEATAAGLGIELTDTVRDLVRAYLIATDAREGKEATA